MVFFPRFPIKRGNIWILCRVYKKRFEERYAARCNDLGAVLADLNEAAGQPDECYLNATSVLRVRVSILREVEPREREGFRSFTPWQPCCAIEFFGGARDDRKVTSYRLIDTSVDIATRRCAALIAAQDSTRLRQCRRVRSPNV